jgi:hypothetical protein
VVAVAWSPDGTVLAVGYAERVAVWAWPAGKLLRDLAVPCSALAASGAVVAVGSERGLALHYAQAERPAPAVSLPPCPVRALAVAWDGSSVVAAAGGALWEVRSATGRARALAEAVGPVTALAALPEGLGVAVATSDGLAWGQPGAGWSREARAGVGKLRAVPGRARREGALYACGAAGSWRLVGGGWQPVGGPAADVVVLDDGRIWWVSLARSLPALDLVDVGDVAVAGARVAVAVGSRVVVVDAATGERRTVG